MTIDPVRRVLDALGASYALIGAHAMAARGYPRFTVDVDLLTTDRRVLDRSIWADLEAAGVEVDPRRGDDDDPLAGVVHIQLSDDDDVDIVVARWTWEAGVIDRAEPLNVMGGVLPVARTSDLILMKLAAGGYLDQRDAAALFELGDRVLLVREIESRIDDVRPDIHEAWRSLRASSIGPQ
jgi:hypothetical protein